ncbi:hypothetical protein [Helicobacter turcicus]|uniref:Uncharacterized protein n=2 Tax=Helicobacter turcicus TaxID=2867412 RepID=A0ABS7JQ67_9HELI|nr:hypothetical protein [Helicobacter turcicus]MBX7491510.1 hypothetical protein [Helicobacter turcicus]
MYSLHIWLGIPGERRVWLEQWDGIPLILKNLSRYFPSIKVFIDGLTAYDGERIEVKDNLEAFWKIVEHTKEAFQACEDFSYYKKCGEEGAAQSHLKDKQSTQTPATKADTLESQTKQPPKNVATILGSKGEKIKLKSLSGYDYRTKICYCALCDIAISDVSTTALVPFHFCKKPGVGFYFHLDHYPDIIRFQEGIPCFYGVLKENLKTTDIQSVFVANFHIPPEHIYNLAANSLEELAQQGKLKDYKENPLKMHRLFVPPVELYAKKYALEKKTKIKISDNPNTKRLLREISYQKQLLKIESLELDIQLKQLQIKQPNSSSPPPPPSFPQITAKERIHSHLAYKLGAALILNSKSLWGYIRMPYVLSYIKEAHKQAQKDYARRVANNPHLKLPNLETYPDYKEALKEKECLTYKLGLALMQADKDWAKGGYLRFYFFDVPRLKQEFKEKRK